MAMLVGAVGLPGRPGETGPLVAMNMREAVRAIGAHLNMLPIESGMSLPIPVKQRPRIVVHRLVYDTRLTPDGVSLTPPYLRATARLNPVEFVGVDRVDAVALGVKLPASNQSWRHTPPVWSTPEELIATYDRFYGLYDVLLPPFLDGRTDVDERTRATAKEYLELFGRLAERPLLPYYDQLGAEFFGFVRHIAR